MDDADVALVREKIEQAETLLDEAGIDCWLIFARETTEIPEPALPLVLGADVVWESALLLTPDGDHHAVVGRYDAGPATTVGAYQVHEYDESIEEPLNAALSKINPNRIAVDYSQQSQVADGLTHGMYRRLTDLLDGTPFTDRFESAAPIMVGLRSSLTPTERERMERAVDITAGILDDATSEWTPNWTEAQFSEYCHSRMREDGLDSAWSWDGCPMVDAGADAEVGHSLPGDRTLPPGEVLHVDFGVRYDGYAADIQRLYYYASDKHPAPPEKLQDAFNDVRAAIDAGMEALEPGVAGYEVDAAVRKAITDRGWPEFKHAAGHTVGRNAHDAGPLLGPRWERYGERPERAVAAGEIYTLELGVETEYGYLGQEEMIEVTDDGATYFYPPQTELRVLSS